MSNDNSDPTNETKHIQDYLAYAIGSAIICCQVLLAYVHVGLKHCPNIFSQYLRITLGMILRCDSTVMRQREMN